MKKVIPVILCALLVLTALLPLQAVGAQESHYLRGDADGNGRVSIQDVTLIQRVLAEMVGDPDGAIALRGDVDGNGLSISDATAIQRFLAEYDDPCHVGEPVTLPPETVPSTTRSYHLPFVPA